MAYHYIQTLKNVKTHYTMLGAIVAIPSQSKFGRKREFTAPSPFPQKNRPLWYALPANKHPKARFLKKLPRFC